MPKVQRATGKCERVGKCHPAQAFSRRAAANPCAVREDLSQVVGEFEEIALLNATGESKVAAAVFGIGADAQAYRLGY